MRTALDHFISEARQQPKRCSAVAHTDNTAVHTNTAAHTDNAAVHTVIRSLGSTSGAEIEVVGAETLQHVPFSWFFEDIQIDNTEVYSGVSSDNLTLTGIKAGTETGTGIETVAMAGRQKEFLSAVESSESGLDPGSCLASSVGAVPESSSVRVQDVQDAQRCAAYSYSSINRPVRVLLGRKKAL